MATNTMSSFPLAWGKRVSFEFRERVNEICIHLGIDPSWLMACIAFETGRTFSPSIRNAAGSGAVGLIQFMPQTAAVLGTSTEELAEMDPVTQLLFVEKYFENWRNKLLTLEDTYCAILWPRGIGKLNSYVLFDTNHSPHAYLQNKGLDINRDGSITKGEVSSKVIAMYHQGLQAENAA